MSNPVKLEFFWDVGSPYTYLASTQLAGMRSRTGAEIVTRPMLLGGVFKSTSNHMPAAVVQKARYMAEDLRRWRDHYGVKLLIPPDEVVFPINSLVAMRVASAIEDPAEAERFMHAVMAAYWAEGIDVSSREAVEDVLQRHGFDAAGLLEATADQVVKDRLRATTDEAVERGVFGAPAMFVKGQLFWGNDRLHFVEAALTT